MKRASIFMLLTLLALGGCARHVVVERDTGRVDGARSITSRSDTEWVVEREPAQSSGEELPRDPAGEGE